jgi:ribosomal protein S1
MADGSYMAKEVHVKGMVFTGTVTSHMPGEFTINVQVEAQTRVVWYEFADVIGTLAVGKIVKVHVDHVIGTTYFASLVKVLN